MSSAVAACTDVRRGSARGARPSAKVTVFVRKQAHYGGASSPYSISPAFLQQRALGAGRGRTKSVCKPLTRRSRVRDVKVNSAGLCQMRNVFCSPKERPGLQVLVRVSFKPPLSSNSRGSLIKASRSKRSSRAPEGSRGRTIGAGGRVKAVRAERYGGAVGQPVRSERRLRRPGEERAVAVTPVRPVIVVVAERVADKLKPSDTFPV